MSLVSAANVVSLVIGAAIGAVADSLLGRPLRRVARRTEKLLGGLDITYNIETDPARMPHTGLDFPTTFLFPADYVPDEPPGTLTEWWSWAHDREGTDVGITKVLITLQGVEDVAVMIGAPAVKSTQWEAEAGVACFPEGIGGGGVTPRRYLVDLSASGGPVVTYDDRDGRPQQFTLSKGDTEQIQIEATAEAGRHEWTCVLPVTTNGVARGLTVDFNGEPFVTTAMPKDAKRMMWTDGAWMTYDL